MISGKRVMALIPARGGSKRLPRKNVLPLAGKPLIGWTIEAAKRSRYIDDIVISTDDLEIAQVSKTLGVKVPDLRPEYLASDTAKTEDVLFYSLEKYGDASTNIIVLLQPTSPLRDSTHIDEAIESFIERNADSVVSVTPCEHSPMWANTLPDDYSMGSFLRPEALKRSQDLGKYYRLNGAVYIFNVDKLKEFGEIRYTNKSYAYVMDNYTSIDIDNKLDFELAEFLFQKITL